MLERLTASCKTLAVITLLIMAFINGYSSSIVRYKVEQNKVGYPFYSKEDEIKLTTVPMVAGPTTDTYFPGKIVIYFTRVIMRALEGLGVISLYPPVTYLPCFRYILTKIDPKYTTTSSYRISSRDICIIFPMIKSYENKHLIIFSVPECTLVVLGRPKVIKGTLTAIINGKCTILTIMPEKMYAGVYTWKSELRLSQLLL